MQFDQLRNPHHDHTVKVTSHPELGRRVEYFVMCTRGKDPCILISVNGEHVINGYVSRTRLNEALKSYLAMFDADELTDVDKSLGES